MNKILAAVAALFMSFALVACGGGGEPQATKTVTASPSPIGPSPLPSPLPDAPTMDEQFADLIRSNVPTFASSPTYDIVDLSKQICQSFDNGGTFEDVALVMLETETSTGQHMPAEEVGFTIGASIAYSCDNHLDKITSTSPAALT
jgi:hypothetical protein